MAEGTALATDQLQLVELVNRVLDRGAVISGDMVISVAGVDLVFVGLRLVLCSVETARAASLTGAVDG